MRAAKTEGQRRAAAKYSAVPGAGKRMDSLDWFRLPAALLVTAIHTSPLSSFSPQADFWLTRVLARIAVPFFFMVSGFFLPDSFAKLRKQEKKLFFLYALSIVLYLPLNLYAGQLSGITAGAFLKQLFFDGTFYHLWYFPAAVIGCILAAVLLRYTSLRTAMLAASLLWLFGLGGDSYFGLASRLPALKTIYSAVFSISSYTRNGIFFAPLFLLMGAAVYEISRKKFWQLRDLRDDRRTLSLFTAGLAASGVLMLTEGYLTYSLGLQRHNSMYLFLVPVMYFLFRLLLLVPGNAPVLVRNISMLVYVIHPAVIIALRGAAKAAGLTWLLVDNTLVQFLTVTAASFAAAALIGYVTGYVLKRKGR